MAQTSQNPMREKVRKAMVQAQQSVPHASKVRTMCHAPFVIPGTRTSDAAAPTARENNNNKKEEFRIQFISDTHIEFYRHQEEYHDLVASSKETRCAPYLALLGDIGVCAEKGRDKYIQFLHHCAAVYDKVFVLLGNHECYRTTYANAKSVALEAVGTCPAHNIVFMDKSEIVVDGVRLLGTTLWSHVPDHAAMAVQSCLNDYNLIVRDDDKALLTVKDTNKIHRDEVAWLEERLNDPAMAEIPTIVMSHHAPVIDMGSSNPEYFKGLVNHAFCTDLRHLLGKCAYWLYGHTHCFHAMCIPGTVPNKASYVLSNPAGYPGEGLRNCPMYIALQPS